VAPVKPVKVANSDAAYGESVPDAGSVEIQTSVRRSPGATKPYMDPAEAQDMDYLDIPAFLRRQAD
jgi:cell division protein FtsZ